MYHQIVMEPETSYRPHNTHMALVITPAMRSTRAVRCIRGAITLIWSEALEFPKMRRAHRTHP